MLRPKEAIRTLPSYHPPLAGRAGLRLDFNENTVGCSPRVLERLRHLSAEDLARYPERHAVEEKLAEFLGVAADEVLLTNGVDEAIHLLCQTFLVAGDEALIVAPTYSMYRIYMMAAGAQVREIRSSSDFRFPTGELCDSVSDRTKLVAIANPNNPTGTLATPKELFQLASAAGSAAVLIDEAYFEFCGQTSLNLLKEWSNVFVTRTFSKAYGMAGLRLGAMIGNREHMAAVRLACSPYNVNAVALACLPTAIKDREYVQHYVGEVLQSRARLEMFLQEQEIQFWPSQANFVLFRVGATAGDARAFAERIRERGILVRDRSSDYACEGCVRITLGTCLQTDRLLDALRQTLADMPLQQGAARR
jgi:histidinol-phosphate aminotransferase